MGLFAVFECGMLKMKCHVVDVLEMVGGQCTALYPEKPIYDIPGHPDILAMDLVANLAKQAAPFRPVYHLGQQVTGLTRLDSGRFRLATSAGETIEAAAVIVAAGVGAFGPNRPPLDGLEAYEGRSIFYYVKRRQDFAGKRVVIAGGGDSAVDWAISLAEIAERVMVVHRRDKFRCAPESASRLQALFDDGAIDLVAPYQLHALHGADGRLTAVDVATLDGDVRTLEADILLPFFGLATALGPIAEWGMDLAHGHLAVDPATGATSVPGIFAIGDVATYPGKLKLILQGFSEAAMAAHAVKGVVHPDQTIHFEHSTTSGVPADIPSA